jgi:hypothetical protein
MVVVSANVDCLAAKAALDATSNIVLHADAPGRAELDHLIAIFGHRRFVTAGPEHDPANDLTDSSGFCEIVCALATGSYSETYL